MKALSWLALGALCIAAILAPRFADAGVLRLAAEILLAISMAQMWNLLAGYNGLMSLGHQLFVAIGAYTLFEVTRRMGIAPWWALPLTGLAGALAAALLAPALFRLREAYFAIGLWVFAEIGFLLVSKSPQLGGTGGGGLEMSAIEDLESFQGTCFWIAAAIGIGTPLAVRALMGSRLGLALLTVRDNELAARSIGVDVWRVRFIAFTASAFGCSLAGAVYYMGGMFVTPDSAFDINWVVMMMFATLIGGIGTITGPIVGVLVWYALRELLVTGFGLQGGWYLIGMGLVAIAASLFAPRGIWVPLHRGLTTRLRPRRRVNRSIRA